MLPLQTVLIALTGAARDSAGHGAVLRLAGPMIISNLAIAMLGLVDTAVIGHLHAPYYLGAVAIAGVLFNFLYWGMGFLRMGTTGVVAQAYGQGDYTQTRTALAHTIGLGATIGTLLLALREPIGDLGLGLLSGSDEVKHYARVYFDIKIMGAPATMTLLAMMGWMLGMQNARATLIVSVAINVLNIALDLLFVVGFDMHVTGVALGSVISEYSGVILGLLLVRGELRRHPGQWRPRAIRHWSNIRRLLALNHNIFLRTVCLIFVFAFFTHQGGKQGDVILAANAVLLNFQSLMALVLDGFAHAIEALSGRAVGAGDEDTLKRWIAVSTLWCVLGALIFACGYALFGEHIIALVTDLPEVRESAAHYVTWMVLSPLISVWGFLLDGIFIGLTRAVAMRNAMLVCTFLVFLPAWFVLQGFGNHGLWLAFLIFMLARGISLGYAFYCLNARGGLAVSGLGGAPYSRV